MTESHLAGRQNALFAVWEGQTPVAIVKDLLSFSPTRHVINTTSGSRFFECCAVDTLLIAHLLDEDIAIETTPPGNTEPLCINVHNNELRVSSGAVIAIPLRHDPQQIRETFCPYANGFPNEDAILQIPEQRDRARSPANKATAPTDAWVQALRNGSRNDSGY
jgi:hypothetical protein